MKISIVILFFVIMVACQSENKENKPKVLLNKKEIIDVIVDVQILESQYANKHQRPEVFANALDSSSQLIFKKHNITKSIFKENLQYYLNLEGDSIFNVYESALDTINNRINSNSRP